MFLNSYLIALLSGIFVYLIMILDAKYIEQIKDDKPVSPKIPLLVTLIVWIICTFQENQVVKKMPVINAINQDILVDPF
jgi:hypothetical protein